MPSSLTCPDDAELLAAAAGELMGEGLQAHLGQCTRCRNRLEQIEAELALLHGRAPEAALVPLAASAMASGPGETDAERHAGNRTQSWASLPPDSGASEAAPPSTTGAGADHG